MRNARRVTFESVALSVVAVLELRSIGFAGVGGPWEAVAACGWYLRGDCIAALLLLLLPCYLILLS